MEPGSTHHLFVLPIMKKLILTGHDNSDERSYDNPKNSFEMNFLSSGLTKKLKINFLSGLS